MWSSSEKRSETPPEVRVRVDGGDAPGTEHRFTSSFRLGRGAECDVQLSSGLASRVHAEGRFERNAWWLCDRDSTNGTYQKGERVRRVRLTGQTRVRIGEDGPVVRLAVAPATLDAPAATTPATDDADADADDDPARASPTGTSDAKRREKRRAPGSSVSRYVQRYFEGDGSGGEHTQMVRQAYERVQNKQRRRYGWVIGAVLVLCAGIGVWAFMQYRQNQRLERAANDIFYQLKEQDLQIARLRQVLEEREDAKLATQLTQLEKQRRKQARRYEGYVTELGLRRSLSKEEQLIYRTARIFNESEFEIPAGFIRSVREEIETYWLTPAGRRRFKDNVRRAEKNGYTAFIVRTMREHGLPPEFFYLALQESNFETTAVGPETRWGIAKGMWQFIPSTGRQYDLRIGPRADVEVVDPQDERHDFKTSTRAAARYLQDIYSELAQASGLLVMASYNWGEHRVVSKLERLFEGVPQNPKDRNYWRFLTEYENRMPEQTKDYVLKIFAAAVIGQNPRHFGMPIDNPLRRHIKAPRRQRAVPKQQTRARESVAPAAYSNNFLLTRPPSFRETR
jgi:soluble lytic murein transglycosylase-like protein